MNLAGELKKVWNMKVTVKPILVEDHELIPKKLEKCLEDLGRNWKKNGDFSCPSTAKMIEKRLRKLDVTRNSVKAIIYH